jgi:dihydrodipicolinate synthase/N-acetylneuraminate lyase
MQPLTRATSRGTWGPVLLPLGEDNSIDFGRLRAEMDVFVAAGLAGCYTNGTAGEFHCLEEAEHDAVSELVAAACGAAGVPFQIGASHMSGQISLSRIKRARELTPSAIQVILPDWFPLSPAEIVPAVTRMAEVADPVPIVLYNPPHAKKVLDPQTFAALAREIPSLVGIKVSPTGPAWYEALQSEAPDLPVFVPGHALASGMRLGGAGSFSNIAGMHPVGARRFDELIHSDPEAALALEQRILAFFAEHIFPLLAEGYSNNALDKTLAALGGWAPIGTRVRWPYRSVPEEHVRQLAPLARAALPELLDTPDHPA